jgi:hypothetical protein
MHAVFLEEIEAIEDFAVRRASQVEGSSGAD